MESTLLSLAVQCRFSPSPSLSIPIPPLSFYTFTADYPFLTHSTRSCPAPPVRRVEPDGAGFFAKGTGFPVPAPGPIALCCQMCGVVCGRRRRVWWR
ncbi:UNVERIFIED_CONTAM: hypothetical protein Sradi_2841500 [Sesamum radiatum]|uniref:Uncharacterized protein n=1 Tax=Sesamum radiatum TaxID=300843 RepID=A0AAW2RX41_SESRA